MGVIATTLLGVQHELFTSQWPVLPSPVVTSNVKLQRQTELLCASGQAGSGMT
jgi:hypothetical protein